MTIDERTRTNMILLAGDWHWRKGPRWRAVLAWLLGRRERLTTHLGDHAVIAWWDGQPFLISLRGREG